MSPTSHRHLLENAYRAAILACNPRDATRTAVRALALGGPPVVIAVGKAAVHMAEGARAGLADQSLMASDGLVVSETGTPPRVGGWPHLRGDHPVPGDASAAAADAIDALVARSRGTTDVIVLLSGGTSSLVAAPRPPVSRSEMEAAFDVFLASGAPITVVNMWRRRLLRWAGGRLAAGFSPARVHCLAVSDVMGGDLAAIGSGPCVPDPSADHEVMVALQQWPVTSLPATVRSMLLARTASQASVAGTRRILLDNGTARAAAARALADAGRISGDALPLLAGEAALTGEALGRQLASLGSGAWATGGEATVTLGASPGRGGRCQELALALAREIAGAALTVLVAGTDGRDGPTDAAGAVVDGDTWRGIARAGIDPAAALARHDAHPALDAVGALLRTGPTGTNVNDLLLAVGGPQR